MLPQQSFPIVFIEFSPGFCVEHRIFLGLCLFLTLIIQVSRKCYSPVWVKYARFSLGFSILDFHWVLDSTSGVLLFNETISVFAKGRRIAHILRRNVAQFKRLRADVIYILLLLSLFVLSIYVCCSLFNLGDTTDQFTKFFHDYLSFAISLAISRSFIFSNFVNVVISFMYFFFAVFKSSFITGW